MLSFCVLWEKSPASSWPWCPHLTKQGLSQNDKLQGDGEPQAELGAVRGAEAGCGPL